MDDLGAHESRELSEHSIDLIRRYSAPVGKPQKVVLLAGKLNDRRAGLHRPAPNEITRLITDQRHRPSQEIGHDESVAVEILDGETFVRIREASATSNRIPCGRRNVELLVCDAGAAVVRAERLSSGGRWVSPQDGYGRQTGPVP